MENRLEYETLLIKEIGKILKDLRVAKEMTLSQLSEGICDFSSISNIENGVQKIPNVIMLNRIAKNLGVEISEIIKFAENNISNTNKLSKKKILNLISIGKCDEAIKLGNEILSKNPDDEDLLYRYYIEGSSEFFKENYAAANDIFLKGIVNIEEVSKNKVLSFIQVFIVNGYFANLFKFKKYGPDIYNDNIKKLLYIQKNSIDYYNIFDLRLLTRFKVYLFAYFRLFGIYEPCEQIINEVESVIEEYGYYDISVDFMVEQIIYYIQINKKEMIKDTIENTRMKLKFLGLTTFVEYLDKEIIKLKNILIDFKSSFEYIKN